MRQSYCYDVQDSVMNELRNIMSFLDEVKIFRGRIFSENIFTTDLSMEQ